jgi:hypothetical protein
LESEITLSQKEIVEEIKVEWKRLWRERRDDKVRAEGVAVNDYNQLFVDRGTIIHATRDFKALNFKDILKQHQVPNPDRYVPPNPFVGGWNKFIKDNVFSGKHCKKQSVDRVFEEKKVKQQSKKSDRGWLHL